MKLRYCASCKRYTMQKRCPSCNTATNIAKPMKYSPEDKYGALRRQAKLQQ